MCKEEKFRWDLYYRLAVAELELPSLIERGITEIKEFIDHFIKEKSTKFKKKVLSLDKDVKNKMLSYTYPGNLRELENIIETFYVYCDDVVTEEHLPKRLKTIPTEKSLLLKDAERTHIEYVLKLFNYNQNKTKNALGITINTLKSKIALYNLI